MLTVHHLGSSQSERIVWLCEELELPYRLKRYERDPATMMAPPEYKALHGFGTAPVITDGDFTLGESGAIVEYLINRHDGGRLVIGPQHADYADYLYWFHFANGSMVPSLMMDYVRPPTDGEDGRIGRTGRALAIIEQRLGQTAYFAGDQFTAADIMMSLPRFTAARDLSAFPNIQAYAARIIGRPAYIRASQKAEPGLVQPSS